MLSAQVGMAFDFSPWEPVVSMISWAWITFLAMTTGIGVCGIVLGIVDGCGFKEASRLLGFIAAILGFVLFVILLGIPTKFTKEAHGWLALVPFIVGFLGVATSLADGT